MHRFLLFCTRCVTLLCFCVQLPFFGYCAPAQFSLPSSAVSSSLTAVEPRLVGMRIFKDDPLRFSFMVDQASGSDLESMRLIKYFFAALTIPDRDLWVNLSPVERDRILPVGLSRTELGRDLLEQDYTLKQIMSETLHPGNPSGKAFWRMIYRKAQELYGTTDVDFKMQHRVWIVPELAGILENGNLSMVMLRRARLKVMLEEDYLARKSGFQMGGNTVDAIGVRVMRELVVPAIQKQVDEGESFRVLRQIYGALILAAWYKRRIRTGLLSEDYVNHGKVEGISLNDPGMAERVWQQYAENFSEGVFDVIIDDELDTGEDLLVRRYTSGGMNFDLGQLFLQHDLHPTSDELRGFSSTARIVDVGLRSLEEVGLGSRADLAQVELKDQIRDRFRQLSFRMSFEEWPREFYAYYKSGSVQPEFKQAFWQVIGEEIEKEKGVMLQEIFGGWVLFLAQEDFFGKNIMQLLDQGPGFRAQLATFKKNLPPEQRYWLDGLLVQVIRQWSFWGEGMRKEAVFLKDVHFIGDYEIRRTLETSRHNITWLGEKEGKMFVIKQEIEPSSTHSPGYLHNENNILRSLSGVASRFTRSYIPAFVAFFREGGRAVLVMEYIEGSNVTSYLSDAFETAIVGRLRLMRKMLVAVDWLHEIGYLHRDIKPENFMIDDLENVRLIDFELAIPLCSPRDSGEKLMGTRAFIAPEELEENIARESIWAPARDIYALGKLMFLMIQEPLKPPHLRTEMFEGGLHFKSAYIHTLPEMMWSDVSLAPDMKDKIEGMIDTLVRQAMNVDPQKRQGSVKVMIGQIDMILQEMGIPPDSAQELNASSAADTGLKGGLDLAGIDQVFDEDTESGRVVEGFASFDDLAYRGSSGFVPILLGIRALQKGVF